MSATAPTATPSSIRSTENNTGSGFGGSNGSLYVFTFSATLIALVIASLGIAWRSFLIRRRFHTRVREALVRGESFPGMEEYLGRIDPTLAAQSRRNGKKGKKMLGPVPMLYEALGEDQRESAELARTKLDDWEGIMPFALSRLSSPTNASKHPSQPKDDPILSLLPDRPTFFPKRWNLYRHIRTRYYTPYTPPLPNPSPFAASSASAEQAAAVGELLANGQGEEVEVFVLVRMPESEQGRKERQREDDEEEVWECDLGMTRVRLSS